MKNKFYIEKINENYLQRIEATQQQRENLKEEFKNYFMALSPKEKTIMLKDYAKISEWSYMNLTEELNADVEKIYKRIKDKDTEKKANEIMNFFYSISETFKEIRMDRMMLIQEKEKELNNKYCDQLLIIESSNPDYLYDKTREVFETYIPLERNKELYEKIKEGYKKYNVIDNSPEKLLNSIKDPKPSLMTPFQMCKVAAKQNENMLIFEHVFNNVLDYAKKLGKRFS